MIGPGDRRFRAGRALTPDKEGLGGKYAASTAGS
jgi:hypothetical protein